MDAAERIRITCGNAGKVWTLFGKSPLHDAQRDAVREKLLVAGLVTINKDEVLGHFRSQQK